MSVELTLGKELLDIDRTDLYYKVRRSGTTMFVSGIVPAWAREERHGLVYFVEGWNNPAAMIWKKLEYAIEAVSQVREIEGFHAVVEQYG